MLGQADRAIALAPDNVWAYWVKSSYLNSSGRPNEALRAAEEGLAINPNYAPLYNARAYAEMDLGRYDLTKSDLLQAMRLSPRDPAMGLFRTSLAEAELGLGHFDAAIDLIHRRSMPVIALSYTLQPARGRLCARGQDGRREDRFGGGPSFNPKLTVKSVARTNPFAGRARRPAQGGAAGGVNAPPLAGNSMATVDPNSRRAA